MFAGLVEGCGVDRHRSNGDDASSHQYGDGYRYIQGGQCLASDKEESGLRKDRV